jgi:ricin-type beta-trefoil lectin protein
LTRRCFSALLRKPALLCNYIGVSIGRFLAKQVDAVEHQSAPRARGKIMKKLLVMMLMAMSLAAIAPAITASPAFAAQTPCSIGVSQAADWFGNKNALERTGGAHVLAIRLPAAAGRDAFLWTLSGNENQKWRLKCVGYDSTTGRNNWTMRYAPNVELCLQANGTVTLQVCNSTHREQIFQKVERGSYFGFRNPTNDICLEARGGGTADGTPIIGPNCTYSAAQLWY